MRLNVRPSRVRGSVAASPSLKRRFLYESTVTFGGVVSTASWTDRVNTPISSFTVRTTSYAPSFNAGHVRVFSPNVGAVGGAATTVEPRRTCSVTPSGVRVSVNVPDVG